MAALVLAGVSALNDTARSRFVSPTGQWRFTVEEGCLGHACSHRAFIEENRWFSRQRECSLGLHADAIVLARARVIWGPGEASLHWYAPLANLGGRVLFSQDCSPVP